MQYIILELKIQNGEYEYSSISAHELDDSVHSDEFADTYSREFYGDKNMYEHNGAHYHHGGCVATSVRAIKTIAKEEYAIVSKYL